MASDLTPNSPSPPSRSPLDSLFLGPKGLRSGWRVLVFISLVLALRAAAHLITPLIRLLHSQASNGALTPGHEVISEAIGVAIVIVAAAIMTLLDRRTFADYGLPLKRAFGRRFWQGVPLGFAMLSLLLAAIWALHGFSLAGLAIGGAAAVKYGLLWALVFFLTGVFEDFLFRGYLQSALGDGIGFWPAALVWAVVFGALHLGNPGEAIFGGMMAVSFGLVSAFSLRRTGNLWLSIGMHMSWDWGETYFYGVPDSGLSATGHLFNASFHGAKWLTGGSVGPEGSWLVLPVLAVWALAIHFLFPAKRSASA